MIWLEVEQLWVGVVVVFWWWLLVVGLDCAKCLVDQYRIVAIVGIAKALVQFVVSYLFRNGYQKNPRLLQRGKIPPSGAGASPMR